MATHADEPPDGGRSWQELVVTVLLVVAALGDVVEQLPGHPLERRAGGGGGRTSAVRIERRAAQGLAQAQTQVDVATFIAWADANRQGDREPAAFYVDRFRDEFQPAFDAWRATAPFSNPGRAADAVRDARVPAWRPARTPSSSTRPPRQAPPRCGSTSSAPATTC